MIIVQKMMRIMMGQKTWCEYKRGVLEKDNKLQEQQTENQKVRGESQKICRQEESKNVLHLFKTNYLYKNIHQVINFSYKVLIASKKNEIERGIERSHKKKIKKQKYKNVELFILKIYNKKDTIIEIGRVWKKLKRNLLLRKISLVFTEILFFTSKNVLLSASILKVQMKKWKNLLRNKNEQESVKVRINIVEYRQRKVQNEPWKSI